MQRIRPYIGYLLACLVAVAILATAFMVHPDDTTRAGAVKQWTPTATPTTVLLDESANLSLAVMMDGSDYYLSAGTIAEHVRFTSGDTTIMVERFTGFDEDEEDAMFDAVREDADNEMLAPQDWSRIRSTIQIAPMVREDGQACTILVADDSLVMLTSVTSNGDCDDPAMVRTMVRFADAAQRDGLVYMRAPEGWDRHAPQVIGTTLFGDKRADPVSGPAWNEAHGR